MYFAIGIVLVLGTFPLFLGERDYPIWISAIMWALAIGLVFAIRKIEFTPDQISIKYLAGRPPKTMQKEDVNTISIRITGDTTAQRVGMMKKDRVLEIRGYKKRQLILVNERFDQSFDEIHAFLKEHYREAFDRAEGDANK